MHIYMQYSVCTPRILGCLPYDHLSFFAAAFCSIIFFMAFMFSLQLRHTTLGYVTSVI